MPKLPQILAVPEKAPLYGSSRLGSRKEWVCMTCTTATLPAEVQGISYVIRGEKSYELSNHLGNVLAVVSDRREAGACTDSLVDFYYADGRSVSDYYPFGMAMDSRTQSAVGYRWGFNGMEKYDDWQGEGNAYDFGARVYDSRLGRWMSVDPLFRKYPMVSPFIFAINSPNAFVDIDGRDIHIRIKVGDKIVTHLYVPCADRPESLHPLIRNTAELLDDLIAMGGHEVDFLANHKDFIVIIAPTPAGTKGSTGGFMPPESEGNDSQNGVVLFSFDVLSQITNKRSRGTGYFMSPQRVLFHELVHAYNYIKYPKKFFRLSNVKLGRWTSREEKRTIGRENELFLGQLPRESHLNKDGSASLKKVDSGYHKGTSKLVQGDFEIDLNDFRQNSGVIQD